MAATRVLSARPVITARFGFNRSTPLVNLLNQANVPSSLSFIPGQIFGHISVSSFNAPSAVVNDPRFFRMNSFQPGDDLTMTRGRHVFKTGVIFARFQSNTAPSNPLGGPYSSASP